MEMKAWQRVRITVVMAVAYTAEHAEAMLLGAMYLAIGRSLDIGASKLGTLSMWRALVQVKTKPVASMLTEVPVQPCSCSVLDIWCTCCLPTDIRTKCQRDCISSCG